MTRHPRGVHREVPCGRAVGRVTFAWADDAGDHTATHAFTGEPGEEPWTVPAGKNVRTKWVEMKPR